MSEVAAAASSASKQSRYALLLAGAEPRLREATALRADLSLGPEEEPVQSGTVKPVQKKIYTAGATARRVRIQKAVTSDAAVADDVELIEVQEVHVGVEVIEAVVCKTGTQTWQVGVLQVDMQQDVRADADAGGTVQVQPTDELLNDAPAQFDAEPVLQPVVMTEAAGACSGRTR